MSPSKVEYRKNPPLTVKKAVDAEETRVRAELAAASTPSSYPWSVEGEKVRFRYVEWKGEPRLFMDIIDEKGHVHVFRIRLEEALG